MKGFLNKVTKGGKADEKPVGAAAPAANASSPTTGAANQAVAAAAGAARAEATPRADISLPRHRDRR